MEKEQNTVELTRAMYKEIKAMNRDQMQQVLTNIYDQGAKSVEHGAIEFESLREEISKINGKRANNNYHKREYFFLFVFNIHSDIIFLNLNFPSKSSLL